MERDILAGFAVVLLTAVLKLIGDTREMHGEMRTMKDFWMRTAERRDVLVNELDRLRAAERRRLESAEHGKHTGGGDGANLR
jgi:hypothetical protein